MPFDIFIHRAKIRAALAQRTPLDEIAKAIGWPGTLDSLTDKIRRQLKMTLPGQRGSAHTGTSKLSGATSMSSSERRRRKARGADA
jgi:hypothetical protein